MNPSRPESGGVGVPRRTEAGHRRKRLVRVSAPTECVVGRWAVRPPRSPT